MYRYESFSIWWTMQKRKTAQKRNKGVIGADITSLIVGVHSKSSLHSAVFVTISKVFLLWKYRCCFALSWNVYRLLELEFIASILMQTSSFKRRIRYMPKESDGIGRIKAKKGYVMPVSRSTWRSLFLFYSHFFFPYFRPLFGLVFSNFIFFLSILYGSLVRMCACS